MAYQYHPSVLEQLAQHGLQPVRDTTPQKVRDALSDLYRYEIRRLRDDLLAGRIPRASYAEYVRTLRNRYWLLSVPIQFWAGGAPDV